MTAGLGVVEPLGRCGLECVLRESHVAGDGDAAILVLGRRGGRAIAIDVYRKNLEAPCTHPGRDVDSWLFTLALAGSAMQRTGEKSRDEGG